MNKNTALEKATKAVRREELKDGWRQSFEQTLDAQVSRHLEISHQGIIGNHYFSAASSECVELYRDGHFISTVMVSHAVNEGVFKLIAQRNGITNKKLHSELIDILKIKKLISGGCAEASTRIWKSFRNDIHHMNPKVAEIPFDSLARKNLQDLACIENEIFGVELHEGKLNPKQPKYWDVSEDGTVEVFLRL